MWSKHPAVELFCCVSIAIRIHAVLNQSSKGIDNQFLFHLHGVQVSSFLLCYRTCILRPLLFISMLEYPFNAIIMLLILIAHLSSTLQDGFTPLYMASGNGHTSIVDVLLRNGVDPNLAVTVSILVVCYQNYDCIMIDMYMI